MKHSSEICSASPTANDIPKNLKDFHTHILPSLDDGAKTVSESAEMLLKMKESGVEQVVLTPHFYSDSYSLDAFLKAREAATEALSALEVTCRPVLYLGAEVAYFPSISRAGSLEKLCIEGTNVLLLEMPFYPWNESVISDVYDLISVRGIQVVLAHVERYYRLGAKKYLQKLLSAGAICQINAEAMLDPTWKQERRFLFKSGAIHLLGSDAHRAIGARSPNLCEGFFALKGLSESAADTVLTTGERLLQNAKAIE